MTAVIGILNKQSIAIAADSAVTISNKNKSKIFNSANKIFTLSKVHPVGIMIYNNASFMGVPWETIIKLYRKQLNQKSFDTIKEYQEDFLHFIKESNYFSDLKIQQDFLAGFLHALIIDPFHIHLSNYVAKNSFSGKAEKKKKLIFELEGLIQKYNNNLDIIISEKGVCDEFALYKSVTFIKDVSDILNDLLSVIVGTDKLLMTIPVTLKTKLRELFYKALISKRFGRFFTGIIFTGFGETEYFPSLISIKISFAYNNKLRYSFEEQECAQINHNNSSAICPFAQTDVIDTILTGIAPFLNNYVLTQFNDFFIKYNDLISNLFSTKEPTVIKKLLDLQPALFERFRNSFNEIIVKSYVQPLLNSVDLLSKEDLAEMAESLIYLTYLQRRMTMAEESVGGPVDVAIISKGDGFIWIKRKLYFKPELNHHFFTNYSKDFNNFEAWKQQETEI